MLIQKLRLQRGWSQQQLAELSGLSARTIQRLENGQPASPESLKALAAVFEVDFAQLKPESAMSATSLEASSLPAQTVPAADLASAEERLAYRQVRKLRAFYVHLFQYLLVCSVLTAVNLLTSTRYLWVGWVWMGWGIGVASHALGTFGLVPFLGAGWEKREVEKRLGRPL